MGTSWDTFPLRSVQHMETKLSVGKVCKEQNHIHLLLFIYFGHTAWLAGSQFPNQGLNPGPCSVSPESQNPLASMVKNLPFNAGDTRDVSLLPESGRSPGVGNGNPLQYSCLENPMDRGAWRATVHRVTESDTTEHIHTPTHTHRGHQGTPKTACTSCRVEPQVGG